MRLTLNCALQTSANNTVEWPLSAVTQLTAEMLLPVQLKAPSGRGTNSVCPAVNLMERCYAAVVTIVSACQWISTGEEETGFGQGTWVR